MRCVYVYDVNTKGIYGIASRVLVVATGGREKHIYIQATPTLQRAMELRWLTESEPLSKTWNVYNSTQRVISSACQELSYLRIFKMRRRHIEGYSRK